MANYSINVTDNGNGTYTLTSVFRTPTTLASGGTNITSTITEAASSVTLLDPMSAVEKAKIMIAADRSLNG